MHEIPISEYLLTIRLRILIKHLCINSLRQRKHSGEFRIYYSELKY